MSDSEIRRLTSFHDKLRRYNLVVEYSPEIPPSLDSSVGGWSYQARIADDGDLMIRVNEWTTLTDEGRRRIWKLPAEK